MDNCDVKKTVELFLSADQWAFLHVDILFLRMADIFDLRMCTFYCRSIKNSYIDINNVCVSHIILIQDSDF